MEKLFIPYETGIPTLSKEKGFDEPCFGAYNASDELKISTEMCCSESQDMCRRIFGGISAPTYDQIKDWLRTKHNIHVMYMVCGSPTRVLGYKWFVQVGMNQDCFQTKMIKDYQEGMTEAIKEAFKLI